MFRITLGGPSAARPGAHRLRGLLAGVLSLGLVVSALTTLPAAEAQAAPPTPTGRSIVEPGQVADGVHGIIWIDLDGDLLQGGNVIPGTESWGDPTVPNAGNEDAGRAGVKIELLDAAQAVVAETTTDASGAYQFSGVADGSYTVRATAPSLNFRWIKPTNEHSDLVGQAEAPPALHIGLAPVTVTDGQSPSVNGGLRTIPAISLAYADGDDSTPGIQGVTTGVAPLPDRNGVCPTEEPGNDCSATDNRVSTNDKTTFYYSVGAQPMQEAAGGGIEPIGDIILEMVLRPTGNAKLTYEIDGALGVPTACKIDREVKSQIILESDGSQRLVCNIGSPSASGNSLVTINVLAGGDSTNGSSFEAHTVAYAATNEARPGEQLDAGPIVISAAPMFNLAKRSLSSDPRGGATQVSGVYQVKNPKTGITEDAIYVAYSAVVEMSGGKKGSMSAGTSFTFRDSMDPKYAQYGAMPVPAQCGQLTPYWADLWHLPSFVATVATPANNQFHSGTYACETAVDAKGSFGVKVNNVDTTGTHVPDTAADSDNTPMTGHDLVTAGRVTVAYPLSALMKGNNVTNPDGSAWTDGDPIVDGTYSITNCYSDFDPIAPSGESNFGSGYEPGWDGTTASGDNCRTHDVKLASTGTITKVYGKIPPSGDPLTEHSTGAPQPEWDGTKNLLPNGLSGWRAGDGLTTADEKMYSYVAMNNAGGTSPLSNAETCDVWDNSMQTLSAFTGGPSKGKMVSISMSEPGLGGAVYVDDPAAKGYTIAYGKLATGGSWGNQVLQGGFNADTGRYTGEWEAQRAAAKDCGTSAEKAGTMVFTTDPIGDGWNLEDINVVRFTAKDSVLPSGQTIILRAQLTSRYEFFGGPYAGDQIPDGAILANFAGNKWGGGYNRVMDYDPNTHKTTGARADRLVFQSVMASVKKTANKSESNDDKLNITNAGDNFTWTLKPSLGSSVQAAIARDVRVVDTLPNELIYQPSCTVVPDGVSGPEIGTNAAGLTTLTWLYGDRSVLKPLPSIDVCTQASQLAKSGSKLLNTVDVYADNITYNKTLHRAVRDVSVYADEGLRVQMSVDQRLDFMNDSQIWKLTWANTAVAVALAPTDTIYVFPSNGDDKNSNPSERRTYGSDYEGTIALTSFLPAPQATGGMTGDVAGQWYYTSAAADTVAHRANDESNKLSGGSTTWCTQAEFGSAGCPATLADVTAVRFIQSGSMLPNTTITAQVPLQAENNAANDLYVGAFGTWSNTFASQPVVANEPYVQVVGFSLGDFIWQDNDGDGVYTEGTDVPAPAGAKVIVHRVAAGVDTVVAETKTNDEGRWVVNGLDMGDYYVVVPADQFAKGGVLHGFRASTAGIQTDPNTDLNETVDNNNEPMADGGLRSAGLTNLSATVEGGTIVGHEPLLDDVTGIVNNRLIGDSFTNLTVDLSLEAVGGFVISKTLSGTGVKDFAPGKVLEFQPVCSAYGTDIPMGKVTLTPAAGDTVVTSDPITGLPVGTVCTITEVNAGGADEAAAPVTITVTQQAAANGLPVNTVVASLTNYYSAGTLRVAKKAEGPADILELVKGQAFELLVVCQVEETLASGETANTVLYSGTVKIKAGQTKQLLDSAGEPRLLPVGTNCYATETDQGTAVKSEVDFSSAKKATTITAGTPDDLQTITITATNTFDESSVPVDPENPGDNGGGNGGGNNASGAGDGQLTVTGAASGLLLAVGAGALILAGLLMRGRRRTTVRVDGS